MTILLMETDLDLTFHVRWMDGAIASRRSIRRVPESPTVEECTILDNSKGEQD
jgi:hypothetical protein